MEFYEIPNFSPFLEKMKKGELTLEEILCNDSIIDDIKSRETSDFLEFFTNEQIKKLIDYSTRFPKSNDHFIGYKYPFHATEILCSENNEFFNKLMSEKKVEENNKKKKAKDFMKKMHKGGFFEVFFKAIKKVEGTSEEELEELNNDNISIDSNDNKEEENKAENNNMIFNYFRSSLDVAQESKNQDKIEYENIDHLLGFLKEPEETRGNYVLDGYFHRILSNLITLDEKGKLIKYLLNYPKKEEFDVLLHFVKNMKRKSKNMFNIIQKLLLFKDDQDRNIYHNTSNNNLIKEKKIHLLKIILNELDTTEEPAKYECICDALCGLMTKTQFLENEYDSLNPLEYLYNILLNAKNNNNKCNYILALLIKINENILKLFDSRCTPVVEEETEENMDLLNAYNSYSNYNTFGNNRYSGISEDNNRSKILEKILMNLFSILEKNKFVFLDDLGNCDQEINNEFMSTYMERQKKIGMKKITQTEYIRTILDIFINACYSEYYSDKVEKLIKLIEDQNIFWSLHKIFFSFPFSNIYQIYYAQIIDIVININSPKCLIDYFFYEKKEKKYLIDIYIDNILSNIKFEFKITNTKVLNPIFSFIINLLNKISNTDNSYLSENYLNNNNFKVFIEIFGKDIDSIFTEKLLSSNKSFQGFQGFNFNEKPEDNLNYFGKKNFMEMLEEDLDIYEKYKKGEDYQTVLEEKKRRIEEEKEERKNGKEKKENLKGKKISDLDDDDEDDDPLFKMEKIKLDNNNENNFLSILNKPNEEVNQIVENVDNIDDNNTQQKNNELDIKELDNDEENINDLKINEELEPNMMNNKVYNTKFNKQINEPEKEEEKESNEKKENDKNENINEIGEVYEDDIVDI